MFMMKIFVCSLSFYFIAFTQSHVFVYKTKSNAVISSVEDHIIHNVIALYNKNHEDSLVLTFRRFNSFKEMLNTFNADSRVYTHSILCVNRMTITDKRKHFYDFSSKYIPGKLVYFKRNQDKKTLNQNEVVGFISGTVQEEIVKKLKKEHTFLYKPFPISQALFRAVGNQSVTVGIAENISVWERNTFHIIKDVEFQAGDGYGIMYPKGSKLNTRLNKYLLYYMKSQRFRKLLEVKYNKEISHYFLKALFSS